MVERFDDKEPKPQRPKFWTGQLELLDLVFVILIVLSIWKGMS